MVLTLNAPAAGSFVVVDSGALTLSGAAQIVLQGGLTANKVTFVNTGTSTVSIGNSCIIQGNILSPNGAISLSGAATYNGTLVSGKAITVANSVTSLQTTWLPGPQRRRAAPWSNKVPFVAEAVHQGSTYIQGLF